MKTKKQRETENNEKSKVKININNLWQLRLDCFENAGSLIKESELLFRNGFYPRSFFLSFTALEEYGKYLVICDYIKGIASFNELTSVFLDHSVKIAYAHSNAELKKLKFGKYEATLVYNASEYKDWIKYRNMSIYCGKDKDFYGIIPKYKIDKSLAKNMLKRAKKEQQAIISMEGINERIGSEAFYK
jgi:AbiV family abortive infection protein